MDAFENLWAIHERLLALLREVLEADPTHVLGDNLHERIQQELK